MSDANHVPLHDLPGGEETMELVADFCYDLPVKDRLTVKNIGHVMCALHYLQMKSFTSECLSKLNQIAGESLVNCCQAAQMWYSLRKHQE